MYVTKDGAVQLIDDATYDFWHAQGWEEHGDAPIDLTELGTAATKDVGTAEGEIPVLGVDGLLDEDVLPPIGPSGADVTQRSWHHNGNTLDVVNGVFTQLIWPARSSGVALLDLTVPTAPTVVAEGVYAVSGQVRADQVGAADTHFSILLDFDLDGEDEMSVQNSWPLDFDPAYGSFAGTYYMPAGGVLSVGVQHDDSSQTVDFKLLAVIQKLA